MKTFNVPYAKGFVDINIPDGVSVVVKA